ncbi:hypothetical protein ACGFZQ_00925 [Streptomyces sp. NPDC048254]|uniref:hypothetical protein n=1 Tax=Streptomyces sp. NPDC048254 TaxID=3365525 RepID=UPI0037131D24
MVVSKHSDELSFKELVQKLKRQGQPLLSRPRSWPSLAAKNTHAGDAKGRLKAAHLAIPSTLNANRRVNRAPVPNAIE